MANNIKRVDNVNGGKYNIGDIELAAIRGIEQGLTQIKMLDVKTQTDTATESLSADDAGKLIVIPNVGQDSVYSLPTPEVGLHFHIVGFGALAADGHDVSFHTATLNTDFFHGAVVHHDTNNTGQTTTVVYADGDSNDKIKLDIPQFFDIHFLGKTSASWYVWGHSASDTVISIGD
tara:strand:- start:1780 stop:2307 length:528 start_codon:yes stop_codon:yes gene_type:complete